jgi:hypothetical protein
MSRKLPLIFSFLMLRNALMLSPSQATAQGEAPTLAPLCQPRVTEPIIVDSHEQIVEGGLKAQPPLTDTGGFGFAWPGRDPRQPARLRRSPGREPLPEPRSWR